MATPSRRNLQRPALSRDAVVAAARAVADREGLPALSMRRLGEVLGVEAMSLYNHVANKDDLLDALLESMLAERATTADGVGPRSWRSRMRAITVELAGLLRAHPWACSLWNNRTPGPARVAYMETMLATLRRGGLDDANVYHAYHVLDIYVVGFIAQQMTYTFTAESMPALASEFMADLDASRFPHLHEHVLAHLDGDHHADAFEYGLDLILSGLGRRRSRTGS